MIALLALLLASSLPGPITGDFDHDGKPDSAAIVSEGGDVFYLHITRGGAPQAPPERVRLMWPPGYMKVAEVARNIGSACGQGAGPNNAPCPRPRLQIAKGDLLLGHAEASEGVVQWSGHDFRLDWITD